MSVQIATVDVLEQAVERVLKKHADFDGVRKLIESRDLEFWERFANRVGGITVNQAATILDLQPQTIRNYMRDGRLTELEVKGAERVDVQSVIHFAKYGVDANLL
ncbi:MAG: hypothetical protein AAFQ37_11900 [Bacteroidota bacterium]